MRIFMRSVFGLVFSILALGSHSLASDVLYMGVVGTKQGTFLGDAGGVPGKVGARPGQMRVQRFNYEITLPTAKTNTGGLVVVSGRSHTPFTVTKPLGAASPQLLQALNTNEVLKTVEIDIYTTPRTPTSIMYYKIFLLNAQVSAISLRCDSTGTVEDVNLVYQTLKVYSMETNAAVEIVN